MIYYLQDYYKLIENSDTEYPYDPDLEELINTIDGNVTPIIVEKNNDTHTGNGGYGQNGNRRENSHTHHHHHHREHHRNQRRSPNKKRHQQNNQSQSSKQSWEEIRSFKTTVIEKASEEGVEKWIQEIRACINKLSTKNYDNQRDKIMEYIDKCISTDDNTDNLKTVANFLFSVASTNKFYVDLYANLYVQLIEKNTIFQDLLHQFLTTYVSSIKHMKYVDSNDNYEQYCQYTKQNDIRKATAVFIVRLVQREKLPMLRLLNIMVAFQELSNELLDQDGRENEVHEISEVLYLFIQEGAELFNSCKGEWIWKFVIWNHIKTMSGYKKGDKKSLASRTIFKYMDILEGGNE